MYVLRNCFWSWTSKKKERKKKEKKAPYFWTHTILLLLVLQEQYYWLPLSLCLVKENTSQTSFARLGKTLFQFKLLHCKSFFFSNLTYSPVCWKPCGLHQEQQMQHVPWESLIHLAQLQRMEGLWDADSLCYSCHLCMVQAARKEGEREAVV